MLGGYQWDRVIQRCQTQKTFGKQKLILRGQGERHMSKIQRSN